MPEPPGQPAELGMSWLYFAYGSNLKTHRMRTRVPSAQALGLASLSGMRLAIDKRSPDGSGKANLVSDPSGEVWGAVYAIDPAHWLALDRHEPRYSRVEVEVERPAGPCLRVQTYVSTHTAGGLVSFDWYKGLIVEGAREHGLPAHYVETLEQLPEMPDPRRVS